MCAWTSSHCTCHDYLAYAKGAHATLAVTPCLAFLPAGAPSITPQGVTTTVQICLVAVHYPVWAVGRLHADVEAGLSQGTVQLGLLCMLLCSPLLAVRCFATGASGQN